MRATLRTDPVLYQYFLGMSVRCSKTTGNYLKYSGFPALINGKAQTGKPTRFNAICIYLSI